MVRKYIPKRHPWADKNKRMARAAELHALGWSLRKIAAQLVVSVGTVHGDLKRWEREHPNVTPLRSNQPFKSAPHGAGLNARTEHPGADIVPIRRIS